MWHRLPGAGTRKVTRLRLPDGEIRLGLCGPQATKILQCDEANVRCQGRHLSHGFWLSTQIERERSLHLWTRHEVQERAVEHLEAFAVAVVDRT